MAFSGTVQSDFLKFIPNELEDKERFIDFAASDFVTLRKNLVDYTRANFPLDYNNFNESDFGMLLIELMAAVGHIQSHKSDYLANENFLRTARERSSVSKLLELIGIKLKGPISAAANASITGSVSLGDAGQASSLTLSPSQRVVSITSPEDGGALTYTLYKVNTDGTIDLTDNTDSLEFNFAATDNISITSAILLEGALVVEKGTFTSPDTIKSIKLTQAPYVEKSAQVFIDGDTTTNGVYLEEDNVFFASGATDKVFQVVTNEDFQGTIMFGDSTTGLSPAVGDQYTVTYRVGGGSRGNIAESFINAEIVGTVGTTTDSITPNVSLNVQNTSQGTGGAPAESMARVKRYGPLRFRSQNRLVTLNDYRAFASRFASNYGSTGKATASVRRAFSSANVIDLFVLEKATATQLRQATEEFKRQLLESIETQKMITDEVVIVDGLIRTLDVNITLTLDRKFKKNSSEIVSRVKDRVLRFFEIDRTDFGQDFSPSELVRAILEEPQVRFATVDNIPETIEAQFNEIIQLNNFSVTPQFI